MNKEVLLEAELNVYQVFFCSLTVFEFRHFQGTIMISLQTLLDSIQDTYKLKLIAGEKGLSNAVSWTFYTEDYSTIDFIRGGELSITTGMLLERYKDNTKDDSEKSAVNILLDFARKLVDLKSAGLIINIGKYIEKVPVELVDFCDENGLPLFTMPWSIHIIDLMQDVGNRIVRDNQKSLSVAETVEAFLFSPEKLEKDFAEKFQFGKLLDDSEKGFFVVLLEGREDFHAQSLETQKHYLKYQFNSHLNLPFKNYCCFFRELEGKNYFIYVCKGDLNLLRTTKKNFLMAVKKDRFLSSSRIAFSSLCDSFDGLLNEYLHAKTAFSVLPMEQFCDYEELGIYKIFSEVHDVAVLKSFYKEILGKLDVLGEEKKKDYLNTLRLYLESSGKVQKTAEENFTHRNTVNYRIHKITEMLGVDLSDGRTRYLIQTALYIREILEKI